MYSSPINGEPYCSSYGVSPNATNAINVLVASGSGISAPQTIVSFVGEMEVLGDSEGYMVLGDSEGDMEGSSDDSSYEEASSVSQDGPFGPSRMDEGSLLGDLDGLIVGGVVGSEVGDELGEEVGWILGAKLGNKLGSDVVGYALGVSLGDVLGATLRDGLCDGKALGYADTLGCDDGIVLGS